MNTRNIAWGLGGAAFVALAACGGTKLNNVGDMPGDGGDGGSSSAGTAGKKGGQAGSTNKAGSSGDGAAGGSENNGGFGAGGFGETGGFGTSGFGQTGGFGAGGFGETGGFGAGGFGTSGFGGGFGVGGYGGQGYGCFDQFDTYAPNDQLELGPQNTVLTEVHEAAEQVKNYANQVVFPVTPGGVWETYANFPPVSAELGAKTDISLPAELASIPKNVAEVYITRPACEGIPVAGHKLQVEVWWKLNGAIAYQPTQGLALGVLDKQNKPTWLADASKAFVIGDTVDNRYLNTLNRIVLTHTFAANDKTDARKIVLALWLLDTFEFPTSFYVGNVKWD